MIEKQGGYALIRNILEGLVMGSEWKTFRLGDHADTCLGKMLDKNKNKGTLHPCLGNKDVRWGRFWSVSNEVPRT